MIGKQKLSPPPGIFETSTRTLGPTGLSAGFLGQFDRRRGDPAGGTMFRHDSGVNAAAHVEFGFNAHESGGRRRHQIPQYFVGHRFVERAAAAERPNVEFQGLQFNAPQVRHVLEFQRGEVGLAGFRAQAAELRDAHPDGVVPPGCGIVKDFKTRGGFGHQKSGALKGFTYVTFTLHYAPQVAHDTA